MRTFDENELCRRVDEVLYYFWDPIGVSEEPCARWEYTSYVPEILQILTSQNDEGPIVEQLAAIVRNKMELTPDVQRCTATAIRLLEHKRAVAQVLA